MSDMIRHQVADYREAQIEKLLRERDRIDQQIRELQGPIRLGPQNYSREEQMASLV